MANFCTKCGKKLEKDEKCTCEIVKDKNNNNDLFSEIKEFIKKPYDTLKNSNKYQNNSYLLLLLTALSFGLTNLFNPLATIIISFMALLILVVSLNYIVKDNYNDTLATISLSSIYLLLGNITSYIISFISIRLPQIIMILSMILFIINIYQGLLNKNNDKNKIGYLLILSIFIAIFITYIILILF